MPFALALPPVHKRFVMSAASPPQLFDRARLASKRDRAAARFSDYAFLKDAVSSDLIERLDDTARIFERGLELGAAGGALTAALLARGKVRAMITADLSPMMTALAAASGLQAETLDEETLGQADASRDLIVSGLGLHWVNDLPGALIQIRKALAPDGLFIGALFGAGTLSELRSVLIEAESGITGALSPRLSPLPALADMAGLLQRAGFALPVADRELITVRYGTLERLFADLKGMGERASFAPGMSRPLRRDVLETAKALYRERFADADGKLRVSFEIVHVMGWAPAPGQPRALKPGSAKVSLADAIKPREPEP